MRQANVRYAFALLICCTLTGLYPIFASAQRPAVGVMDFAISGGVDEDIADFCVETLTEAFVKSGAFQVIDRNRVRRALDRLKKVEPDLDESESLTRLMGELDLEELCRGSIRQLGGKTYIRAKRSNREGAVLAVASRSFESPDEIERVVTELAQELIGAAEAAPSAPAPSSPTTPGPTRVALTRPDRTDGVESAYVTFLYNRLTTEILNLNRLSVVDWQEVERGVRASVAANPRLSPEEAQTQALRSLGVAKVLIPSLTRFGDRYYLSVRVLNRNLTVERTVDATAQKEAEIDNAIKDVALRLSLTPEEWAARQKAQAEAAKKAAAARQQAALKSQYFTNSIGMEFKLIPPGAFIMGSRDGDPDEEPIRKVTISKPFYMGVHEVTQEQYEKVMRENPSRFKGANLPVERVSWMEAQEFCLRLSVMDGKSYRLPTEAEWEYACRSGSHYRYFWGEEFDPEYAWYAENSNNTTQPVGTLKPNPWGLFDMSGNVWEWCQDWYADSYGEAAGRDPTGPKTGRHRVVRGGSWFNDPESLRSANRRAALPSVKHFVFGFRVVRE